MIDIPNYNVIIPVAYKDFDFLPRTIKYVNKNIKPSKIIVILDARLKRYLPNTVKKTEDVVIADENSLIKGMTFNRVKCILEKHGAQLFRTGWFLQQFLKLGFALSDLCDTEYYLSWDADTLPLRKLKFFSETGHPLFAKKKEHNEAYFDTLSKVLSLKYLADFSYIAEHMMFNKNILIEMFHAIEESRVDGDVWFEKIVNATDPNDVNSFSEFETYGNYCLNYHPDLYQTRVLNTFRKAGYIAGRFISDRKLYFMGFDLDTASFELGDYPCGLGKYVCFVYYKYLRYKDKIIKGKLSKI